MNSGKIAGISPYEGKPIDIHFFHYRQLFVDILE
jgi:hypothetical protein